ncbi:hypothetical protein AOC36_06930 [Erysipelothrix larvae]|uniref:Uncharacterized protein n=1 Tax=Erysipelothrix larvae TaxID=1514105 RepID=A0A0X8H0F2_9FIRM|nr:hypothetical protein [Erysipelothrix larvae]AMC93725.1 hypothetical protein AOC36_06930 [Erysipelothrix larvae]
MRKRTPKIFVDYNDYHDRHFGLKWGTAFALAELVSVIDTNKKDAKKEVHELPEMSREEIDHVLQHAFLKSKKVSIQMNIRDHDDHLIENVIGKFEGFSDSEFLYIDGQELAWELIRNVQILK